MNISSVLIHASDAQALKRGLTHLKNCSLEREEGTKLILLLETPSYEEELALYKKLESLEGVGAINMVFSYQDLSFDEEKLLRKNVDMLNQL